MGIRDVPAASVPSLGGGCGSSTLTAGSAQCFDFLDSWVAAWVVRSASGYVGSLHFLRCAEHRDVLYLFTCLVTILVCSTLFFVTVLRHVVNLWRCAGCWKRERESRATVTDLRDSFLEASDAWQTLFLASDAEGSTWRREQDLTLCFVVGLEAIVSLGLDVSVPSRGLCGE